MRRIFLAAVIFVALLHSSFADKMIILKGIRSLLDVPSAVETATVLGYEPIVIKSSGENYLGNPQLKESLEVIRKDKNVTGIYGFSGGGYNTRHIFNSLTPTEKKQIKRIIVLGSPGVTKNSFTNVDVTIVPNSPKGHMDTPRWYLEKIKPLK